MRDYIIMTDSCCDLSADLAQELELEVVPLSLQMGGKTYRMERFWKEDRVFLEKHYLFPIPTEELQRANIPQNPNW